jgi:hypothetical protein
LDKRKKRVPQLFAMPSKKRMNIELLSPEGMVWCHFAFLQKKANHTNEV